MGLGVWLTEVVLVLSFSKRTQWAILLGIIGFFVITFLGSTQLDSFELQGAMAPFLGIIKDKLLQKYDKAAYGCLGSFWLLAFKLYRLDKKRFLIHF